MKVPQEHHWRGTRAHYVKSKLVKGSLLSGPDPDTFKVDKESKVNLEYTILANRQEMKK